MRFPDDVLEAIRRLRLVSNIHIGRYKTTDFDSFYMPENSSLFNDPEMVVSLLVPNTQNESVSYKYLKDLCKSFALKSKSPDEFVRMVNDELGRETSKTRRQALFDLKQRAIGIFALDEQ